MHKLTKITIRLAVIGLASCISLSIRSQASFQLLDLEAGQFMLKVLSENISQQAPKEQLRVYVRQAESSDPPPILGHYQLERNAVLFSPLLSFKSGKEYTAVFQQKDTFHFSIPEKTQQASPRLIGIYPSADSLPENLLKFYLYFDQPMAEGQAYSSVFIEKKDGSQVEKPFLELQPELWNEDQTRLTLWLDPGRVKRDLGPNQLMGPPLHARQTYHLRIDTEWESSQGVALDKSYRKTFHTYSADRQSPDPKEWSILPPVSGSTSPVQILFNEALDFALLQHTIRILDEEKIAISGKTEIGEQEKNWSFTPDAPWKAGKYHICIEARLEDLAANNLNRPFDRDVSTTEAREQEYYWISFEVSGKYKQ